jgi:membrane associated rhomboid family serine protease
MTSDSRAPGGLLRTLLGELPATKLLMGLCLLVFAAAVAVDHRLPIGFSGPDAFRVSTRYRFGVLAPWIVEHEPWRVLSAVFFHFSLLHLGMNLWGLFTLGGLLERRFGQARSVLLFLLAGVAGFVVSVAWDGFSGYVTTAGASGGVFGQLGGVIGVLLARRLPGWKDLLWQNLLYAVALGFIMQVNNAAHLGGLVVGLATGYLLEKEPVRPLTTRVFGVLAVLGVLASVASVALSSGSAATRMVREREQVLEG